MTDTATKPKGKPGKLGTAQPDDGLTQSARFMQAARELETDDDPKRFAGRVKALAKSAPVSQGAAKKATKRLLSE